MHRMRANGTAATCLVAIGAMLAPAMAHGSGTGANPSSPGAYRVPPQVGDYASSASGGPAHAAATTGRGVTYAASNNRFDPVVVKLARSGRNVTRVVETWTAECQSGDVWPEMGDSRGVLTISKDGSFAGTREGQFDLGDVIAVATATFTGKVSGRKLTATQSATILIIDKQSAEIVDTCGYQATSKLASRRGRVYGGATSQHGALVLERSANGRRVKHLHVGWTADCTPSGWLPAIGDTVTNFPLKRGVFGDRFSQTVARRDGGTNTLDYAVSGKVRRASASGKIDITLTSSDPSGAQEGECRTGALSWKAQSG